MTTASSSLPRPTFSVVVETANVGRDDDVLRRALASIAAQRPTLDEAQEVVLLVEPGAAGGADSRVPGEYPFLRLAESPGHGYGDMKAHAAAVTTGDVVVFADSDCVYRPGWLESLLAPFDRPDVAVVTGETAIPIRGPYSLAVAATFNFPGFTDDVGVVPSSRYWANNVAVRRRALEALVGDPELSRGDCVLHAEVLCRERAVLLRQPAARSLHSVIPVREFGRRYFELGRDHAALRRARARRGCGATAVAAFPPDRDGERPSVRVARRISQAVALRPSRMLLVPLAVPIVGAAAALHALGRRLPRRHPVDDGI